MRKIIYGALGLVLIGVIVLIMELNTSDIEAFTFSSVDVHETRDVSAEGIRNILIDSPAVDVNVQPTSDDKIEAVFSGKVGKKSKDLYKLDFDKDGDTVKISMEKENKFQFMMFNFTRVSLNIKVPEKVYHSIKLNAASGDMAVDEVEAKKLTIETKSGDIEVSDVRTEDTLSLTTSSGDIAANNNHSKRMEMETSSGDITTKDNVAKGSDLLASSGDIISDNQALEDSKIHTSSGDISVEMDELKGNIELKASSGDIDVNFTKAPTSLTLDYKSSSGEGTAHIDDMKYSEKSEHRMIGEIGDGHVKLTARTSSGDFQLK
ncbi:DUF4097 family beta strand repeat-containing protein [Niallia oryzisoli]|uniref:DUF4097 family beta strand repeat-containing protein n=1 Tax=Niallia oryzisoli TaxID=1737571 RepID=A0ABZ2CBK7_9BACI